MGWDASGVCVLLLWFAKIQIQKDCTQKNPDNDPVGVDQENLL
jgi:hypothetical protein